MDEWFTDTSGYYDDYSPSWDNFSSSLDVPDWSQYTQDPAIYQGYEPAPSYGGMLEMPRGGLVNSSFGGVGGSWAPSGQPSGQSSDVWSKLLLGGLGAAPGLMGMIGTLAGGGQSGSTPNIPTNQRAMQAQASQALGFAQPGANQLWNTGTGLMNQLGMAQNPMQQQQQSILAALAPQAANMASGDMQIPPQLRDLVRQAYEPYVGDIAEQAINSARNRGFSGGADLLQQGPAGAIAGPALARSAGMQAQSLLDAMVKFPQSAANIAGAYNQPINQMTGIANSSMTPQQQQVGGYQNLFNQYPYGTTQQGNIGQTLGQQAGQTLGGFLGGYQLPGAQAQQQTQFNTLLNALKGAGQSAGGMSGIY